MLAYAMIALIAAVAPAQEVVEEVETQEIVFAEEELLEEGDSEEVVFEEGQEGESEEIAALDE
jgi:hypothetical protein